jgi:hypothetical protein
MSHDLSKIAHGSQCSIKTQENPFKIPTDEEVFMLRDEEKRRRAEERKKAANTPVYEKSTWSTRLNLKRHHDRELDKELKETNNLLRSGLAGKKQDVKFPLIQGDKHEKENMAEFIEKKRQLFLIQMSLDTKKQEIKKLEKKAEERERKLMQEDEALKRDAQRFDNFLTNNDIQAVQAIQRAEEETKAKQVKQNDIKKLNARKSAIKNDINKIKDQLAKCMTYKNFLDSLTPESWFKESDPNDMYFKKPEQLLAKFTALEEENLFLIQSSQEIDEQLDELKKQEHEAKEKMDKQAEDLRNQIENLEKQIQEENEQKEIIQRRLMNTNDEQSNEKLKCLKKKIREIFESSCDASILTDDPDPIYMLTQIESKLESLLSDIGEIKDDFIIKHEKARDKERRKQSRDAKNNRAQQAPIRKPKEKAPVKLRVGKPLMQRSKPLEKKSQENFKKTQQEDQIKRDEFNELFA